MTSVYNTRKPRNVRSVYARSQTDESAEQDGAAARRSVRQRRGKVSKVTTSQKVAENDRGNVKEPSTGGEDNQTCESGVNGPSKRSKTCKTKRGKVGRPSRVSKKAKSSQLSLSNTIEDGEQERPEKKRSSVSRNRKVAEASGPAERRISKEAFVTSSTLSQLKYKIKENREAPRVTAVKEDSEDRDRSISQLKPFVCGVCQRRYGSEVGLREHEQVHRWDSTGDSSTPPSFKQFVCDVCNKAFKFKSSLTTHRTIHSEVKPFVCDTCGKAFTQERMLKIHLLNHTGERPFECDFCNKSFLRQFDLDQHRRVHTGERPYVCNVCDKAYMRMTALKRHKETHAAAQHSKSFHCDQCPKSFSTSDGLHSHKKRHGLVRSFECETCHKKFRTRSELNKHSKIHARDPAPKKEPSTVESRAEKAHCICDVCGASVWKTAFKIHMRKHTGERPYVCKFCHKAYIQKHDWQIHERRHTGERPFACHICPATYARNDSLVHHIQCYHLDNRPYVCDVCDRAFKAPKHLKDHKLIHLDLKPHKCSQCGKGFRQRGSLRSHMRSHTGEKPYACWHCSKRFFDSGARIRHMRIHTGEKPYKCSQCDAEFARTEPFKHHRETVHQDFTVIPLNVLRKPMVKAALLPAPSVEITCENSYDQEKNNQDTACSSSEVCPQPSLIVSCEPVLPVSLCENRASEQQSSADDGGRVIRVLEPSSSGDNDRGIRVSEQPSSHSIDQAIVVQPEEAYASTESCPVSDIHSGPTVVVQSTNVQHSASSRVIGAFSGQMLGQERSVNVSGTGVVGETLPSHYSHSQIPPPVAEKMEYTVDPSGNVTGTAFKHEAYLEAQVGHGGQEPSHRVVGIIEVKYDGSIAHTVSTGESDREAEQEEGLSSPSTNESDPENEDFEAGQDGLKFVEHERVNSSENDPPSRATEYVGENFVQMNYVEEGYPLENETVLISNEYQVDTGTATNTTEILVMSSLANNENIVSAAFESQADSYSMENRTTVAVVKSESSSHFPKNFLQVYHADGTGSVTILESQTDPANAVENRLCAEVAENTSGPRVTEVEGVGFEIIANDSSSGGNVNDGNHSALKDEQSLPGSVDAAIHQPPAPANTNIRFNKKNKPTAMKMDASAFGDTLRTRRRSAYGQKQRDWICEACGKGFTQKSALKTHLAVVHKVDEDVRFACDVCNKLCTGKQQLEEHKRTHTGEKPFVCEVCGNTYRTKHFLRQHILVAHIGRRPYACEVCHKTFTERNSLRDHKLIHQGLKPHKCPTCGKCFTQWGSLSNHKRIHSGVKLACQYCGKEFSEKSSFSRHQRIHTGEKPYSCERCPAAFARSEQLKRHVSREHPGDLQNLTTLADAVETLSKEETA